LSLADHSCRVIDSHQVATLKIRSLAAAQNTDRQGAISILLIEINAICDSGNLTVTIPKKLPALEADNKNNQGG
jgi:hypothetical protein